MSTIAFIGLGIMGSPMACHLARAGHSVIGYNRSPGRAAELIDAGGTEAESIADAVQNADVVAVMVPDSPTCKTCCSRRVVFSPTPGPRRW